MTDLARALIANNKRAEDANPVEMARIEAERTQMIKASMVRRGLTY